MWPAVAALRIRCAVENELDRSYQVVRKFKAPGLRRKGSMAATTDAERRERTSGFGSGNSYGTEIG